MLQLTMLYHRTRSAWAAILGARHICGVLLFLGGAAVGPGCSPKATLSQVSLDHQYAVDPPVRLRQQVLDGGNYIRIYIMGHFAAAPDGTPAQVAAQYRMRYELLTSYGQRQVLRRDTLDLSQGISLRTDPGGYQMAFNLPKPEGLPEAVLALYLQDKGTLQTTIFDLWLPLSQMATVGQFAFFDARGIEPRSGPGLRAGDTVSVRSLMLGDGPLYLRHWAEPFAAAPPPMAVTLSGLGTATAPSRILPVGRQQRLILEDAGYYQLTDDTTKPGGAGILVESGRYPRVTRPTELSQPLIYMITRSERAKLASAKDLKVALDAFWLEAGGSRDYARKLIRSYYEYVELANAYFTDYRQGWRTDRGMVYIIFGKPGQVFRQGSTETWTYDERSGMPELRFIFDRKTGPVGTPVWELRRNSDYDRYWYTVVDRWRKGGVRR